MSDPRPPLQRAWHTMLLLLGIVIVVWLILTIIAKIWLWLVLLFVAALIVYVASLWIRSRRNRW
jgi:hypothetical protein